MTAKRKTEEKRESFSDLIHPIHNYTKSKFCIIKGSRLCQISHFTGIH